MKTVREAIQELQQMPDLDVPLLMFDGEYGEQEIHTIRAESLDMGVSTEKGRIAQGEPVVVIYG